MRLFSNLFLKDHPVFTSGVRLINMKKVDKSLIITRFTVLETRLEVVLQVPATTGLKLLLMEPAPPLLSHLTKFPVKLKQPLLPLPPFLLMLKSG